MRYVAVSVVTDRQIDRQTDTHTHTHTQNDYRNPAVHAPRVKNSTNLQTAAVTIINTYKPLI